MQLRFISLLLSIFFSHFLWSQKIKSEEQKSYYNLLIEMRYPEALALTKHEPYSEIKQLQYRLSKVLLQSGQKKWKDSISTCNHKKTAIAQIYCHLINGYQTLYFDRYNPDSFDFFSKALQLAKEENSIGLQKLSILGILDVYNFQLVQTNEDCKIYLDQYLRLVENESDNFRYQINLLLFHLRNISLDVGLKREFLHGIERTIEGFKSNHPFWVVYYSTVGVLHEVFGNMKTALDFHWNAIRLIKEEPFFRRLKFRSFIRLSEIHRRINEPKKALVYIDSSKKYIDLSDTLRARYYLYQYSAPNYLALGDYRNAYTLKSKALDLKDTLSKNKNSSEISRLNRKYQTAEKERQILIEQQKAKTNRNWLIAAGLALLLGTGIAILLQKNTTKKRQIAEQEAILKQQRVDNLLKEQELLSIDAMIAGQEKERQKVAGELHDDLGSLMATIKLHFDNAKVSKKDPALQNAQKLLEEAYQKIRGMAHNKSSGVMSDQGLLTAIKKMAKTISETDALEVTVEDFGLGERMKNSLELSIFRMVQELVANTIKHAEATKLSIQLTQHEDNLNIIVEDNGKGFNRTKVAGEGSGMGLTNIEKRVEHLEGSFTIDSILGKGTSILIDIPV